MNKNILFNYQSFEQKIAILDQQPPQTFLDINPNLYNSENLRYIFNFLYHGIRFQNHLEKLESIFQDQALLASHYQRIPHSSYSDNCNEGEYISLLSTDGHYDIEYETFILPNISLIISPECNAIKTIYLPYEEWEQVKGKNTKNRYSYAFNEYQSKQMIPISMIKAIGFPARYLRGIGKEDKIEQYLQDILALMNKYNISLPIVDTSAYNNPLVLPPNHPLTKSRVK